MLLRSGNVTKLTNSVMPKTVLTSVCIAFVKYWFVDGSAGRGSRLADKCDIELAMPSGQIAAFCLV